MDTTQNIYPLKGIAQHYAWGGYNYLPQLLKLDNSAGQPYAEWWMGDHPSAPSFVLINGRWENLAHQISLDPQGWLGAKAVERFGTRLPFLFKILDVRSMLSIQAHPTKAAAEEGFRRENEEEIPLNAPNRTYKDDNHKPEIMVALTDFWLLHGFRPEADIATLLASHPELFKLLDSFVHRDIQELYQVVMELPQSDVDKLLHPLCQRLCREDKEKTLSKDNPDFWAARAFREYTRDGHYDRGIFSIYLLNLLHLKPGEGVFQDAGVPHAYLEGVNVELMANSDNVFRGGLTPKHVDVDELLENLVFQPVVPHILSNRHHKNLTTYKTPAPDFELRQLLLDADHSVSLGPVQGPLIGIVLNGNLQVNESQTFAKGESFIVRPETILYCRAVEANAEVFFAGLPGFA